MPNISSVAKYLAITAATAAVISLAACARPARLSPAPSAHMIAPDVASATHNGIKLKARPDTWNSRPQNLDQEYTPMLVSIANHSHKSIVIRYSDFTIQGSNGKTYHAIPPFNAGGNVSASYPRYPIGGFYAEVGFFGAPYYGDDWDGPVYDDGPFDWDQDYWNAYSRAWAVHLPTRAMMKRALAEGVLSSGGRIRGFLYFQKVPSNLNSATFRATFKTPKNKKFKGRKIAAIAIPFNVQ